MPRRKCWKKVEAGRRAVFGRGEPQVSPVDPSGSGDHYIQGLVSPADPSGFSDLKVQGLVSPEKQKRHLTENKAYSPLTQKKCKQSSDTNKYFIYSDSVTSYVTEKKCMVLQFS